MVISIGEAARFRGAPLTRFGSRLGVLPPSHLANVTQALEAVGRFPQAVVISWKENRASVCSDCSATWAQCLAQFSPVKICPQSQMLAVFRGQPGP